MPNALIEAAIALLDSGDDEGCDGLVVVSAEAYRKLQAAVQAAVGQHHGIQLDEPEGEFSHRYDTTTCPSCKSDLTQAGNVAMFVSVGENIDEVPTRLDADGLLLDVDGLIANGYHSDAECGICGHRLTEHEIL